ncbi:hypothetical protein MRB53_041557 [Persea americana]|nr:hypothetical protein MRB53_041557 [Persea americana]
MLIGICGGICAGKATVQQYLIEKHGFTPIKIPRIDVTPSVEKSASEAHVPSPVPTPQPLTYPDVNSLLDFVTANWQKPFVTTSIYSKEVAEILSRRPFFILLHIDAPISIRWQRFKTRCSETGLVPPSLESFVLRNDEHMYAANTNLAALASQAQIKILNTAVSLQHLHKSLDQLDLTDPTRLRPSWDYYFMLMASLAARRSNCMKRRVGCVLVRHSRVIATGYNGTPRNTLNCASGGCPRCNNSGSISGGASLSTCLCIHAEENALLEAGRERVGEGAVLYCTTCPCLTCSIKIVQVGITEVVYGEKYYMDAEAAKLFTQAGIRIRQFAAPETGLVDLGSTSVLDQEKMFNSMSLDHTQVMPNGHAAHS